MGHTQGGTPHPGTHGRTAINTGTINGERVIHTRVHQRRESYTHPGTEEKRLLHTRVPERERVIHTGVPERERVIHTWYTPERRDCYTPGTHLRGETVTHGVYLGERVIHTGVYLRVF